MKKYLLKWLFKWIFNETWKDFQKTLYNKNIQIMNLKEQITFYQMKGKIK